MYESNDKMVSHPKHYQSKSGLEVIDVIEAFTDGLSGIEATDTGNIIKYACRWNQKNGIQDLEKIMWYTQHLIDHLKSKEKKVKNTSKVSYRAFCEERESKRQDMILFIFETKEEAVDVILDMQNVIKKNGFISLSDFYKILGFPEIKDDKHGWRKLDHIKIVERFPVGFSLQLPKVETI